MNARDEILARVRAALITPAPPDRPPVGPRPPLGGHPATATALRSSDDLLDRFARRLADYRAAVTRCPPDGVPEAVAAALSGELSVVAPGDLPHSWLARYPGEVTADAHRAAASLTGCAAAVAETGTIILDTGPAQGPRILSLLPDLHVCVVHAAQVHADVPGALAAPRPAAPQTWISGPSATSDIELDRVEGVHGPRRLHVILVQHSAL